MLIHEIHEFELQIETNSFKCMIMATFSDTLLVATEKTETSRIIHQLEGMNKVISFISSVTTYRLISSYSNF